MNLIEIERIHIHINLGGGLIIYI